MVLSREYPDHFFACLSLVLLDIGSHWLQMYSQLLASKSSHKDVDPTANAILRLYYTNRIFMGVCCVSAEALLRARRHGRGTRRHPRRPGENPRLRRRSHPQPCRSSPGSRRRVGSCASAAETRRSRRSPRMHAPRMPSAQQAAPSAIAAVGAVGHSSRTMCPPSSRAKAKRRCGLRERRVEEPERLGRETLGENARRWLLPRRAGRGGSAVRKSTSTYSHTRACDAVRAPRIRAAATSKTRGRIALGLDAGGEGLAAIARRGRRRPLDAGARAHGRAAVEGGASMLPGAASARRLTSSSYGGRGHPRLSMSAEGNGRCSAKGSATALSG